MIKQQINIKITIADFKYGKACFYEYCEFSSTCFVEKEKRDG